MPLPLALVGAGVGAVSGGVAGAAASPGHRFRNAALGMAAGGAAGGAAHGALRTARLKSLGYGIEHSLEHGFASPDSINKTKKHLKTMQEGLSTAATADTQAAEKLHAASPFHGMSAVDAKKHHRAQMATMHPDKGGDVDAFNKFHEQYKAHIAANPAGEKVGAMWHFFFQELTDLAASSQVW